jgi:hypothetical protein
MRIFAGVTLCLCLAVNSANAQTTTPSPTPTPAPATGAAATGQKIGGIVSAAIDTAFPIIGKIMDLFRNPNKKNASKTEVQAATNQTQQEFMKTVKMKIQPVATVAKELSVMQTFSTAAVNVHDKLIPISSLLEQDKPDDGQIETEWTVAKNYLADANAVKREDIQAVADLVIQAHLLDLQNARRDLVVRIDKNISLAKSNKPFKKQELVTQFAAMNDLVKGLNSLAAIEFTVLQSDVESLSKWANGGADISTPKPKIDPRLLSAADHAVDTAKKAVDSTAVPQE